MPEREDERTALLQNGHLDEEGGDAREVRDLNQSMMGYQEEN